MAVTVPTPDPAKDVWGTQLNAALTALDGAITTAVTTAQSASTLAGSVNTALGSKADASTVYTKTAADARFVRTVNGSTPDGSGNIVVSPVPGVRVIYWDGTGSQPLRSTQSTDLTQPVIWMTPLASPPAIATGYAINGDLWFVLP